MARGRSVTVPGLTAPVVPELDELGEHSSEEPLSAPDPPAAGRFQGFDPKPRSAVDAALGWDEAGEEVVRLEAPTVELDEYHVETRVVYLGTRRKFSQYFPGTTEVFEDDTGHVRHRAVSTGATTYVFDRLDANRIPIRARLTTDGKPFVICRHIGHLALFEAMRDANQEPVFEVRSSPPVKQQLLRYLAQLRELRKRPRDEGRPVLEAMGLTG